MRNSVMVPMNGPADKVRLVISDVTQIGRVSPETFENPGVRVGDVSTMKPASNPVTVQHRNGARRAEAVRATTGT
jgi:hypothetical protein